MKQTEKHIFINGKIFTADDRSPFADSMVTENGRIVWIGKMDGMPQEYSEFISAQPYTGSGSPDVTDLGGRRVIPGFIDAHMHPVMLADFRKKITAMPPEINSIEDLIGAVRKRRGQQAPGEWIEGWGYDEQGLLEKRSPTRYDLDRGCSDSPVSIMRTCAHIRCVNSMALKLAGIDRNTPDPPGGEIERDENGEPTGVLKENARNLIVPLMPQESVEQHVDNLLELGEVLTSQGITTICDMGNLDASDNIPVYEAAAGRGFHQRVGVYYMWDFFADDKEFHIPEERFDRNRQIFAAGLKLIGDGSISGRTAWMNRPYYGSTDEYGISVCSDHLVETAISFCRENHCQLSMHAMGGRAISRMIDRACKEEPWTAPGIPYVRVEHVTDPSEESIRKAAEHGISFVSQPIFPYAESKSYLSNLGTEWMRQCYPYRDILDADVTLGFSTDAPATFWSDPSDPFPGLKLAVTRTAADGTDCGKDQAVDIAAAVTLYTKGAALAAGFPDTGMLKAGYHADFAVLSDDILNIPADDIDKVRVVQTYIGGKCVYERQAVSRSGSDI